MDKEIENAENNYNVALEVENMPYKIYSKRIDTKDFRGTVWIVTTKNLR